MAESAPLSTAATRRAGYALAAVILVVFALQWLLGEHGRLGELAPTSLLAQGALEGDWVRGRDEWYRLASSVLLHRGWAHAVFTAVPLVFAAWLAPGLGGWRLVAWFGLGALAGSASTLLLGPADAVSAGGAGGALAVVVSALVTGLAAPPQPGRFLNVLSTAVTLLTALVVQALVAPAFLVGSGLAAVVLAVLARREPAPGAWVRPVALACAAVLAAGAGLAFARRPGIARDFALRAGLAPDTALDRLRLLPMEQKGPALQALAKDHPRDPRVRHYLGLMSEEADEAPEAEEHLARGLAERELLEKFFPDGKLEGAMRTALTRLQLARGAEEEARRTLAPACAVLGEPPRSLPPEFYASVCGKR